APLLPMSDQVGSEVADAGRGAVHGVHRGDGLLDAAAFGVVQAISNFAGLFVDLLGVGLSIKDQFDDAALVVHLHRRAIVSSALQVVDVDVVAKDLTGVPISLGDRGAGEGQQSGMGNPIAQVPSIAIEVVVRAAVRLIDDDDDV